MTSAKAQAPVILLLDDGSPEDAEFVRGWLDASRFNACEAPDVFGALEEISDFTLGTRPDVILLNVSRKGPELGLINAMVKTDAGQPDAEIISMAAFAPSDGSVGREHCDMHALAAVLNKLIPRTPALSN